MLLSEGCYKYLNKSIVLYCSVLVIFVLKPFFVRFVSPKGIPFHIVDPIRENEFSWIESLEL